MKYSVKSISTPNGLLLDRKLSEEDIRRWRIKSLRQACILVSKYAKKNHKYRDDLDRARSLGLGGLTSAIHWTLKDPKNSSNYGKHGYVYVDDKEAPYARYQIEGTKAHGPKYANRLRWFSDRYGVWITKMRVAGIVKDDFIRKAVFSNRLEIHEIFEANLRRLLDGRL